MKFNDDSLMLFDLDNLDYTCNTVDNEVLNCSTQFEDFDCDLELSNNIKSSLIDEIDIITNETDFTAQFCEFTDSLFSTSNKNLTGTTSNSSINLLNNSSNLTSNLFVESSSLNSLFDSTNSFIASESKSIEINIQDRHDMKKKLLDMTQRKLTNTICSGNKLRNQVLLKSALKSVNSIDEDNLLGNKSTFDKQENLDEIKPEKSHCASRKLRLFNKFEKNEAENDQDNFEFLSLSRKRNLPNFKSNSLNQSNEKEILDGKNKIKKQKLCHQLSDKNNDEYFIDENNFKFNDELTLNNLANCFIRLKTQQSHD